MIPEKYIVANSRNLVLAQCTTTKPNTKVIILILFRLSCRQDEKIRNNAFNLTQK